MAKSYLDLSTAKLDYRELLTPPEGYIVDYAVGTTYSLDLQALLTVPLAFGFITDLGDDIENINKLYTLSAITETKKKFSIFCDAKNIKIPGKKQDPTFHKLLDDCVFTVNKVKASFHPKVWIISFKNIDSNKTKIIRVGILSRNLTFDNSFDVAAFVDGSTSSVKNKNPVLYSFLKFLQNSCPSNNHRKMIAKLITNVAKVKEFKCPTPFSNVKFHFFNKGEKYFTPQSLRENVSGLAIVSPFLSSSVVKEAFALSERKDGDFKRLLITMQSQYKAQMTGFMDEEVLGFCGDDDDSNRDVHAKIIFQERKKELNRLFLGSLNLTYNAFYNNAEFMAEFEFEKGKKHASFEVFKELFSKKMFQNIKPINDSVDEKKKNEISFEEFFENIVENECSVLRNTRKVHLKFSKELKNFEIKIFGLNDSAFQRIVKDCYLSYDSVKDICEFFVLRDRNSKKEIVVKISLDKKPEKRDDELKNSLFENSDDNMIEYLKMLLPRANAIKINGGRKKRKTKGPGLKNVFEDGLYEKMLKMMRNTDCKERLKEISDVLKKMNCSSGGSLGKVWDIVNVFTTVAEKYCKD